MTQKNKQKALVEKIRQKAKRLRSLGYSNKQIEDILRELDLPLGAHLRVLQFED